jgi:cell division protease FtsH
VLLWVFFFAIAVLALQFVGRDDGTTEITYTELSKQIAADNIESVEVLPDAHEIRGQLRQPLNIEGKAYANFRAYLPFEDPAPVVARLEEQNVTVKAKKGGFSWFTLFLSTIPWILIIGFWILIMRQMRAGGERALSFGRATPRQVTGERPKVTFADVAGVDEAKVELQEIIDFLRDPTKFQRLGGRLPKGVLLVGPPGTGKTLLARAVAGEAGCPFFSISGSDFVEMFVGVGASRVRNLFAQGKTNAPCIIFIDELDAVGRQRGAGLGGGHDEREQTLNQLLVELDGFEPNEGVILLAATNRPDVLDPALLRPGRFDRQVVVDMPDVRGREMIVRVHARKIPLAEDVDLAVVARGTPGLAGADLANIVNEAALLAARRRKEQVDMADFEDAKDKVMLGVERKSLVLTEEERRLTAYHEAGHTLLNVLMPGLDPIQKVTIVPRGRALGLTATLPEEDRHNYTKQYILGRLVVAYGGRVAEELVFGEEKVTTGAAQDFQQATDLARRMVSQFGMSDAVGPMTVGEREEVMFLGREVTHRHEVSERTAELVDQEIRRALTEAYQQAKQLLTEHRATLDALAEALQERESLGREAVEALVAGKRLPPQEPASEAAVTGPRESASVG